MRRSCPLIESLESRTLLSGYFVSTTGSDSALGTAAAPWRTLQKAADTVKAGDVVTAGAGNYAGFSKFGLKGTASSHIVFKADPGVNIVSRNSGTSVNSGIELSGYDSSTGSAYIDLYGFNVNNASGTIAGNVSSGLRVRFSHDIGIYNCKASNNGWVGIYCAYVNNVIIDGCTSSDNNGWVDSGTGRNHGIYIANSSFDVTITNCVISGNNGNGIHCNGDGGVNTGFRIENNTIFGNGAIGGSAINCDGIQNSSISFNLLYNNKAKGISLYAIDASGESTGNVLDTNDVIHNGAREALQLHSAGNVVRGGAYTNRGGPAVENDGGNTISGILYLGSGVTASWGKRWIEGDFDFDGHVTPNDFTALDSTLGSDNGFILAVLGRSTGIVNPNDYTTIDANLGRAS